MGTIGETLPRHFRVHPHITPTYYNQHGKTPSSTGHACKAMEERIQATELSKKALEVLRKKTFSVGRCGCYLGGGSSQPATRWELQLD